MLAPLMWRQRAILACNWVLISSFISCFRVLGVLHISAAYIVTLPTYFIGMTPSILIMNILGNQIFEGRINIVTVLAIIGVVGIIMLYYFRHEIKKFIVHEILEIEQDMEKVEKKIGKAYLKIIVSPRARRR